MTWRKVVIKNAPELNLMMLFESEFSKLRNELGSSDGFNLFLADSETVWNITTYYAPDLPDLAELLDKWNGVHCEKPDGSLVRARFGDQTGDWEHWFANNTN